VLVLVNPPALHFSIWPWPRGSRGSRESRIWRQKTVRLKLVLECQHEIDGFTHPGSITCRLQQLGGLERKAEHLRFSWRLANRRRRTFLILRH
jgi:hypothetical protein